MKKGAKPMNAIKFIKDHGVEKAREVITKDQFVADLCLVTPSGNLIYYKEVKGSFPEVTDFGKVGLIADDYLMVDLSDLKRLVESIDMVKEYGGITMAKRQCACFTNACINVGVKPSPRLSALQQAIADYEQLFGNTETLELETLRDCDTSTNCKKLDERVK